MTTNHSHKLEAEKQVLLDELNRIATFNPESKSWEAMAETADPNDADPNDADPNSQADRFENFEESSALIIPLEARLMQVEEALKKLKDGSYGTCRICGNAIEEARLNANPAAETCMNHLEE